MTRLEKFESFKTHAWFKKLYKKLSNEDILLARGFIVKNEYLTANAFESAVNRMFLGRERPANWNIISELLANCNVIV